MSTVIKQDVVDYYDTHPINERQIIDKLSLEKNTLHSLNAQDLYAHDQDHYGGTEATKILGDAAELSKDDFVLDICSGMGGPSRYLSAEYGCRVTSVDMTFSRCVAAKNLSNMVGLSQQAKFIQGNAQGLPFQANIFDCIVGQEAWCHVPSKEKLIAECWRTLKPGGRVAFTDIVRTDMISSFLLDRLKNEMTFHNLATATEYKTLLEKNGFAINRHDDLSQEWTELLEERLRMYRSLSNSTAKSFGEARSEEWDVAYTNFVGHFGAGELGGVRFIATKL